MKRQPVACEAWISWPAYERLQRVAQEQMVLHVKQFKESILVVDPEATFTELHDEIVVECRNEHKEAVVRLLTGGQP